MQFTVFNKAIAATVGAALVILGLVFKQDLGTYADLAIGLVSALTPIAVYLIPNFAKKLADGGDYEDELAKEAAVAGAIRDALKPGDTPKA